MEEKAKKAFFEELYQLDQDYSEEDQSNAGVILRQSKPISSPSKVLTPDNLPQASSLPKVKLLAKSSSPPESPKPSTQVIFDTPTIGKKAANMPAQKGPSKMIGKRKRGQSLEMKPESQQIFSGLAFCGSQYP